ncbi:unnamed protein product [Brassica oleracea]
MQGQNRRKSIYINSASTREYHSFDKSVQQFIPISRFSICSHFNKHYGVIINSAVQKALVVDPLTTIPQAGGFESPFCFAVLGVVDEAETEKISSFSLTRDGRETKPPIK